MKKNPHLEQNKCNHRYWYTSEITHVSLLNTYICLNQYNLPNLSCTPICTCLWRLEDIYICWNENIFQVGHVSAHAPAICIVKMLASSCFSLLHPKVVGSMHVTPKKIKVSLSCLGMASLCLAF